MKAELSVDEMDTLADFRARLEAQLEIIDKIIDGEVGEGEERQEADARAEEDHEEPRAHP